MNKKKKEISIFGLGYVGCILSACFANKGLKVIGIDVDPYKVELINKGRSPIVEPKLTPLLRQAVSKGRLKAGIDIKTALNETDISLICVGTPSLANGDIDYTYLRRVIKDIAEVLLKKNGKHTILIRSTIFPGTVDSVIKPIILKIGGKKLLRKINLACNPEFLREGSAIDDFYHPSKTVIGVEKKDIGKYLMPFLYSGISGSKIITDVKTAEAIKYIDNCFHGLKVAFANEIGRLSKSLNIDSHQLMAIFCQDKKLNLSSAYLKPGKPFGGSCLPKDVAALTYRVRKRNLNLPVIGSILASNDVHRDKVIQFINSFNKKKIGIVGLSFKENTDDLRNSPLIEIVKTLIRRKNKVLIYEKNISLDRIFGSNKEYLIRQIPTVNSMLINDLKKLIRQSEIIVIANKDQCLKPGDIPKNKLIIDLIGVQQLKRHNNYYGLLW